MLKGSHAEVDVRALGVRIEALLMMELSKHKRETVDVFLDELDAVEEVKSAFLVTGQHDIIAHVLVRDMQHLKNLTLDRFTGHPAVVRVETSIIFESRTRYRAPVLGSAADAD